MHPITTMRNSGRVGAVREGFQEEVTLRWLSEDEEAARGVWGVLRPLSHAVLTLGELTQPL